MGKYNYDNKDGCEIFRDILDGKVGMFPRGYWRQPGVEAECAAITRYFIEDVLKWEDKDIREKTNEMVFRKHHLSGMLEYVFGRSPFLAIDNAYPDKYKAWELTCIPKHFWEEEKNRNSALAWLLDKTGKIKINELTNKDFLNNGLGGLMDYLTSKKVYKKMDRTAVEAGRKRKDMEINISFSVANKKSGRNKVRARLEIPPEVLKEIGVSQDSNRVSLRVNPDKNEIIIKSVN